MKRFFLILAATGLIIAPMNPVSAQTATASGSPSSASNAGPSILLTDPDLLDVDAPNNGIGENADNNDASLIGNGITSDDVLEESAIAEGDGPAVGDDLEGSVVNSGTGFGEDADLTDVGINSNSPGGFAVGDMDDTVGSSVGIGNRTLSPDLNQAQLFAPNANPGAVVLPGVVGLDGLVGIPASITTFSPSAEAVNIVESSNLNQNNNVNNSSAVLND